jgi:hypothetical protein
LVTTLAKEGQYEKKKNQELYVDTKENNGF